MLIKIISSIILISVNSSILKSQILMLDRCFDVNISDKVITLCEAENRRKTKHKLYYYKPDFLRLSIDSGEGRLTSYKQGEDSHVILHIMLEWGLSNAETKLLEEKLIGIDSSGIIGGAFGIQSDIKEGLEIQGENSLASLLRSGQNSVNGSLASYPNQKMVFSFLWEGTEADEIIKAWKKTDNLKNTTLCFNTQIYGMRGRANADLIISENLNNLLIIKK